MSEGFQFLLFWTVVGALTAWQTYNCTGKLRLQHRTLTAILAGIIWPVTLFFALMSGVATRTRFGDDDDLKRRNGK